MEQRKQKSADTNYLPYAGLRSGVLHLLNSLHAIFFDRSIVQKAFPYFLTLDKIDLNVS